MMSSTYIRIDSVAIDDGPLYIAPGETTFTPPTGPYLLEE